MVKGLDLFQKHFESFIGQYILIGGAACDLLYEYAGLEFRATKDLDIVLCLESLETKFTEAFWAFVRSGDYRMRERSSGRPTSSASSSCFSYSSSSSSSSCLSLSSSNPAADERTHSSVNHDDHRDVKDDHDDDRNVEDGDDTHSSSVFSFSLLYLWACLIVV